MGVMGWTFGVSVWVVMLSNALVLAARWEAKQGTVMYSEPSELMPRRGVFWPSVTPWDHWRLAAVGAEKVTGYVKVKRWTWGDMSGSSEDTAVGAMVMLVGPAGPTGSGMEGAHWFNWACVGESVVRPPGKSLGLDRKSVV